MAYDDLFGLPRSSRNVIPEMFNSENKDYTGYMSLPISFPKKMTLVSSNSVAQMLEKRRHKSQESFFGVWQAKETLCDTEGETDEEIQNDFVSDDFDTDLGFDSNIMASHKTTWERDDKQIDDVQEILEIDKNNTELPWLQGNSSKLGNNSNTDDRPPHITTNTKLDSTGDINGSWNNPNGKTEKSSLCVITSTTESVSPNIDVTQQELSFNSVIVMQIESDEEEGSTCNTEETAGQTSISAMSQVVPASQVSQMEGLNNRSEESMSDFKQNQNQPTLFTDSGPEEKSITRISAEGVSNIENVKEPDSESSQKVSDGHQDGEITKTTGKDPKVLDIQQGCEVTETNGREPKAQDCQQGCERTKNKTIYQQNNRLYGRSNRPCSKFGKQNYAFPQCWPNIDTQSTTYYKYHTKELEDFARANGLKVYDVEAYGSCMFLAVEDQMRINAQFGLSAKSLRRLAVDYLRTHPVQKDGGHLKDFLFGKETWEDYLTRMEKNSTWGDHLTLKALCEVVGETIVVFNPTTDDIRRTEIVPTSTEKTTDTPFYLGHIGEYHYLSLRPMDWEKRWPSLAEIYRQKMTMHELLSKYISARVDILELKRKIAHYEEIIVEHRNLCSHFKTREEKDGVEKCSVEDCLAVDLPDSAIADAEDEEGLLNEKLTRVHRIKEEIPNFFTYKGWLTHQSSEWRLFTTPDPLSIDPESGLPLPHLSFILQYWINESIRVPLRPPSFEFSSLPRNFVVEYAGSSCDATNAVLVNHTEKGVETCPLDIPMLIICRADVVVMFETNENKQVKEVFVDETQTRPGYCRLRPSVASSEFWGSQLLYLENDCFIQDNQETITSEWREYRGFQSHEWIPSRTDWVSRARPSGWPSEKLRETIQKAGVIFIHRPHFSSQLEYVEWQIIFSKAEKEIFLNDLSPAQKKCFNIFKVLVEHQTRICPVILTPTHLKAVFLYAMEQVPLAGWESNLGSCFLYVIRLLSSFLENGKVPHYFISENNLIDHIPENDLQELILQVNTVKHFPIEVIRFCLEKHNLDLDGFSKVVADIDIYRESRDIYWTVEHVFVEILRQRAFGFGCSNNFMQAHEIIQQAYLIYLQMLGVTNSIAHGETLDQFVMKMLEGWTDVKKFKMFTIFDERDNTTLSTRGQTNDTMLVGSLFEEDIDSEFKGMPVPTYVQGNKGEEASLLEEITVVCYNQKKNEDSMVFIKRAITLLKKALLEDILDVSEVEDAQLKREIGRKNVTLTSRWNNQLYSCYGKLSMCCNATGKEQEMMAFMPDIESLAERMPTMVPFVEQMWTRLGQSEKGKQFRKEHGDFQKNTWNQNEFGDVD